MADAAQHNNKRLIASFFAAFAIDLPSSFFERPEGSREKRIVTGIGRTKKMTYGRGTCGGEVTLAGIRAVVAGSLPVQ